VVINGALNNLPYGGLIHLAGNTTFFTYNPINITGSLSNQPYWIIEGEGREVNSTVIQANNPGFDTIIISNAARFTLRDMRINGSTSGRAIYASAGGVAPNSFIYSQFDNLWVQTPTTVSGTQNGVMYLVNPFQSGFRNIYVAGSPTSWVARLENDRTLNYGNNHFQGLCAQNSAYAGAGCHCLSLASTGSSTIMNQNTFEHVQCVPPSSSVGPVGIYLGPGAQHNWFYGFDCEMGTNGIVIECASTSSNPCFDNHFFGGYGTCITSNCIQTDANTYGCTFNKLCLGIVGTYSTGNVIADGNSYTSAIPNVYEDIIMIGGGGSAPAINGTTRPIFRGIGGIGAGRYFENYGTSTQSGNGSKTAFTITHNLVGKPFYANATNAIAGLPAISSIVPGATALTVNYASAPASGTNNVVLNWYARF